ncbi:MAG: hypothetical protein WD534_01030 [Phycisphaeraceae bacterium]
MNALPAPSQPRVYLRHASPAAARERGVALMLVVVALVMATMLAVPFLAAQSTSSAVGQNIARHSQAQAVAESGLELTLAYIHAQPDWRQAQQPGAWLDDYAFADGTIDVHVESEDEEATTLDGPVIVTSTGFHRGVSHTVHARVEGSAPTGGGLLPYGLAVAESVTMTGNVLVNAMDSRVDTYSPWAPGNGHATVATNATGNNQFSITGSSTVDGDVLVGHGGNASQIIKTTGTASVTGDADSLDEPMTLPSVTLPSPLPASQGDASFSSWGVETLTDGTYHYDAFAVSGSLTVHIEGDVVIVADDLFQLAGSSSLILQPDATLTVYADRYRFTGNVRIKHQNHHDPTATRLYQTGTADLDVVGSAELAASIVAPDAQLDLRGNARLFGAFQGDSVSLKGSARFTQDHALLEGGGGTAGSDGGSGYIVRWFSSE